jgi:hypothetical protein
MIILALNEMTTEGPGRGRGQTKQWDFFRGTDIMGGIILPHEEN